MIDVTEFKRRLAAGEFDEAVRRLLNEMDSLEEPEVPEGALSLEMRDVLNRGRLLGQSTLIRLRVADASGSDLLSSGPHNVVIQLPVNQTTPTEVTLTQTAGRTATLSGLPADTMPLNFVVVKPAVMRTMFQRPVVVESSSTVLRAEPQRLSGRIHATTAMTALSGSTPSEIAGTPKPRPTFEVAWNSKEKRFDISTAVQDEDGKELLVLVVIEDEDPVPVVLEQSSESDRQLIGCCPLPDELHREKEVDVKVDSIEHDRLSELRPEAVSLWLATQPMISLPLTSNGDEVEFILYEADRVFLRQHPDAILAIRVAPLGKGVA